MRLDDDIDLTCPKCNGQMVLNEEQTQAVCPYCGNQAFCEDESPERVQEIAYAYRKGVLKAEEEAAKKAEKKAARAARNSTKATTAKAKKSGMIRRVLIAIGVFAAIAAGMWTYEYATSPEVDPFEAIDVVFEGTSGSGYAWIETHSPTSGTYNAYDIDYEVSQHYGLKEGDKVTVTASSTHYRLSPKTKVYTVEGLDMLLDDLDALSDQAIAVIHARSEVTLKKATSGSHIEAGLEALEPVAVYLFVEGGNHNRFYDVFRARFSLNGETSELYLVADYDDIVVRDGAVPTIDYGYTMATGDYIEVFDSDLDMESHGGYINAYRTLEEVEVGLQHSQRRATTMQKRPAQQIGAVG